MKAEHATIDLPPARTNGHRYWLSADIEQPTGEHDTPGNDGGTTTDNPIQQAVRAALDALWETLEGDQPNNLYDLVISQIERPLLETAMIRCGQNQSKAAECLGINRSTLRKKLRQHQLLDVES